MINICVQKGNMKIKNYLILYINNGVGRGVWPMSLFNLKTINGLIYEFNIQNQGVCDPKTKREKKREKKKEKII